MRVTAVVGVVVVSLLGVSCSSGTARTSTATTVPATVARPTAAGDPHPPPLRWRPCGDGFQCSRLTVPLDYAHPDGTKVQLAVIRRPASDRAHRVGALVVNPGGPGASGIGIVRGGFGVVAGLGKGLGNQLDIVSWDTRGTGASQPLSCGGGAAAFLSLPPDPPDAAAQSELDVRARAIAQDCGAHAQPLLDHVDTDTTARDLEQLRLALGGAKLTYAGYSYGTAIGLAYASRYPTHIRAMVLDGVVDPTEDMTRMLTSQAVAMEQTLQRLFERCRAEATCPVADPSGTYERLAAQLVHQPEKAGASTIGPADLATAAVEATYDPDLGDRFLTALAQAAQGDGRMIAEFADSYRSDVTSYVGYASVMCLDFPHPVGAAAWQTFAVGLAQRAPMVGAAAANELLPCAFWPAGVTRTPEPVTASGSPTILVVGNTGDAATPYSAAVSVARHLQHGVLLTYQGSGHTSLGRSDCADAATRRYLVDLRVPPPHALCLSG
jgi:pimeloyl-ACP methyl ester carboxylesterase